MSDEERDLLRRVHTACQAERPEILAWLVGLCVRDWVALVAALKECATGPARKALDNALAKLAAVDSVAAAEWAGQALALVEGGRVKVTPGGTIVGEVSDAKRV